MTAHSPSATNILAGLDVSVLNDLTSRQRAVLAVITSRAAERAYRRGVQQGVQFGKGVVSLRPDLHEWRYADGADASPGADTNRVETSLDRLHTENGGLAAAPVAFPREIGGRGVGQVDFAEAVARLRQLAADYQAAWDRDLMGRSWPTLLAASALRAFAMEMVVLGGGQAMTDAFDELVEQHGWDAARGVSGVWTGIAGWSA